MTLTDRYLSVTHLTRYIKQKLETDQALQHVWLKGEISNFKRHSRGHLYLTLKDSGARIRAVMFVGAARALSFQPEDGMKVLVEGAISLYEPYGDYQIYIQRMEQDGLGRLHLAYEALKRKLEQKGWFDVARKRPLPAVSREIGIVTSPTGAVIRDLFVTIKRRFPAARVTLFPVLVQGPAAASAISKAIRQANTCKELDLLIVGRGGGSIEDLWAFNEEIVAEAIVHSRLPVISAVGHETDFTIADFVADKRAATPTAAGEFAVADYRELKNQLEQLRARATAALRARVRRQHDRLDRLRHAYAFSYPRQLLLQKEQQLDQLTEACGKAALRGLAQKKERVQLLARLLRRSHPNARIAQIDERLSSVRHRLTQAFFVQFSKRQSTCERLIVHLNALSPLRVMARGYSLAYTDSHELIKSVRQVSPGDELQLCLYDGKIDCQIWGIDEEESHE
ncbi:MAG: exodeoxyribonuclease VII large subunit [Sporolactobacillus sp.]